MKIIVYTCITGNYEQIREDQNFDGADFYMFSPLAISHSGWQHKHSIDMFKDPRMNARYHKLIPHEFFNDADYIMWIDGSIKLIKPASYFVEQMGDNDILTLKHPDRNCLYDEAVQCIKQKLDDIENILREIRRIRDDGFPPDMGLAETKIVLRRNTNKVKEFNKEWFYQLMTGTLRDQISFPYVAYLTNMRIKYLPSWKEIPEILHYEHHKRVSYA